MLKTSLFFVAIALIALLLADLEISTLHPWTELSRMAWGVITPDVTSLWNLKLALLNTVVFAVCGIFFGVVLGIGLAFAFRFTPVRLFCAFIRAIHEIFWAFIFLPIVGLNPICGVLAIAIPYAGIFAKVYAEIIQESDRRPLEGVPKASGGLSRFVYGILPIIYADAKHYTSYRFECALRSSAILGFIGLPTLGFHLETAFREGIYSEAWALLYAFYILIASLRYWLKPRLVPLYVVASFVLLSRTITVSWENIVRFFTYDLLPWPHAPGWCPRWHARNLVCLGTDLELGKRDFCPRGMGRDMEYSGADAGCVGRDGCICAAQFSLRVSAFLRKDRQPDFTLWTDCYPHHTGVHPRIYPCTTLGSLYAPSCLGDSPA